jgi:NADP-dependent 3-hydroxy acid dehydrogenase YdfG
VSHETFGSTDIVLANAGINLPDNLLEEDLDEQGKLKEPQLKNIDVNLRGVLYCTKLALFYFRKQPGTKCQLVVTGSVAR